MSEKLCTLRTQGGGGGGKVVETVLWTNPSPTSNFSAQTVTLSDSISNYDYIKVVYGLSTSIAGGNSVVIPVSDFKQAVYPQVNNMPIYELGAYNTTSTVARGVMYASDTTVRFSPANNIAATGSADNRAIPTSIVGIKHMYGKMEHYATGYFSSGHTSVDLGFEPKYVFCSNGGLNSSSTVSNSTIYDANVSTTQYHMLGPGVDEMRNIGTIGSSSQFCMEGTVIGISPSLNPSLWVNGRRYYVAIG